MILKLKENITYIHIISVIIFAVIGFFTWESFQYVLKKNYWVDRTNNVLSASEKTISHLKDLETGQRGFLLTSDSTFLEPFLFFVDSLTNDLLSLKNLTDDNLIQQNRTDSLQNIVGERLAILQRSFQMFSTTNNKESLNAQLRKGKRKMDEVRKIINRMQNTEKELLVIRKQEFENTVLLLKVVIITLISVLVVFVIMSYVFLSKQISKNQKNINQIYELNIALGNTNEELATANEELTAANEEIKTANEELVTSNEDLQQAKETIEHLNSDLNTRLIAILENTADLVSYTNHQRVPIYMNPAGCQLLGLDENFDFSTTTTKDFYPKEAYATLKEASTIVAHKGFWQGEIIIKSFNGDIIPVWQQIIAHKGTERRDGYFSTIVRDLRDVKKAQYELVESEKRYKMLFENNPQPMWVFDSETLRFLEVNKTATHKYGYSRDEFLKMTIKDIRPQEDIDRLMQSQTEYAEGYRVSKGWKHVTKDGSILDVEILLFSFKSIDGRKCKLVLVNDITEKKIAENKLTQMNRELAYQNEQLDKYTYIISHNVRGPVATLLGLVEIFNTEETGNDNEHNIAVIDHIKKVSQKLDEVILDLNKVLTLKNQSQLAYEKLYFKDLTEDILTMLSEEIERTGAVITYDFNVEQKVYAFKSYMHSIFINLISNAIKYAQPGKLPTIHISSSVTDKFVFVSFKDSGLGIDLAKNGDKIFGLYKRFHHHVDGKGLGLHLVKIQAEAMGGKIEVKSIPGNGSIFKLWIPVS